MAKPPKLGSEESNTLLGRDKIVGKTHWPPPQHIKEHLNIFSKLIARGMKSGTLLDIGCGDGAIDLLIAEKYPNVKITATDLDKHPQWRVNKNKNLRFKTASIYDLSYKDRSFDVVIIKDVLHHLPDPETAIKNIVKLANKKVIIIEANRYNPISYIRMVKIAKHEHFSQKKLKRIVGSHHELYTLEAHVWPTYFTFIGAISDKIFSYKILRNLRNYNVIVIRRG